MKKIFIFSLILVFGFVIAGCSRNTTPTQEENQIPQVQNNDIQTLPESNDKTTQDQKITEEDKIANDIDKMTTDIDNIDKELDIDLKDLDSIEE